MLKYTSIFYQIFVIVSWFLGLVGCIHGQKLVYNPNIDEKTYTNPIIHADYSDPDVIRVGEDYYLVSSSFSHFPGLPILHSVDLINWVIIGHAALQYPDASFSSPQHGDAIWAPSMRYYDSEFYIYFGDPDRGVFMTKTKNPAGPWEPLKLIKKVTGWIDCCPFWDDDGKAYLVHAYANSRVGLKGVLMANEMSPNGLEILGTSTLVFNGQKDHNTIEGPKFYKRNGYYYIFAPAGGVATGWQTVLRSKNIFGPYEDKIVLEQGRSKINGPHQGAWIDAPDGSEWFIHFQDKGAYGRIVHLQPLRWENDWPVIGIDADGNGIGEPVENYKKPIISSGVKVPQTSDEFDSGLPGLQWQWQSNPNDSWLDIQYKSGFLKLKSIPQVSKNNLWMQPNLLLQKFPAENFTATTMLELYGVEAGDKAGLIVFGLDYSNISIEKDNNGKFKIQVNTCKNAENGNLETIEETLIVDTRKVYFRVEIKAEYRLNEINPKAVCNFKYSLNGTDFFQIGKTFEAREGKWVGAKIGLLSIGNQSSYTVIDWFRIKE